MKAAASSSDSPESLMGSGSSTKERWCLVLFITVPTEHMQGVDHLLNDWISLVPFWCDIQDHFPTGWSNHVILPSPKKW